MIALIIDTKLPAKFENSRKNRIGEAILLRYEATGNTIMRTHTHHARLLRAPTALFQCFQAVNDDIFVKPHRILLYCFN